MRKILAILLVLSMIAFGGWRVWDSKKTIKKISSTPNPASSTIQSPTPPPQLDEFNKTRYSNTQPGSLWLIVNKSRPLPSGYVPAELVVPNVKLRLSKTAEQMQVSKDMQIDLEAMFTDAKKAGFELMLASGFRSEAYQKQLYNSYVAKDGQAAADRYSARPGTSEHQTGLAADVGRPDQKCELEVCFGATNEGKWVAENAHKYGFIVRYLEGKELVTTYQYEPWHLRYVGKELATELVKTSQTMEEFFGL